MTPYWDTAEPLEPIAPGQADPETAENILEPRCWCGRLLLHYSGRGWFCSRHGDEVELDPIEE